MPELDRFEKSFRRGWIRPYRLARSGTASDYETSDAIITALCQSLRDFGGVPGFEETAEILDSRGNRPAWAQFAAIEEVPKLHGGHRHTEIAAQVAKSILVQQAAENGPRSDQSLVEEFATRTCHSLLDHYFFANARSKLIAQGVHVDHVAAREWQSGAADLLSSRIEQIAKQLINDPRATALRAPKRTAPRRSTEDLLDDNLLSEEPGPVDVLTAEAAL